MAGYLYDVGMGNLFIQTLQTNPPYFFAVVITVVISIVVHELAHGYAAIKLGDDTPIVTGHMTLNPIVHMGAMSLILLAIAGIAFGAMPVDRTRLRGRYGEAIMAVAGPASNVLLALLTLTAVSLWDRFDHSPMAEWSPVATNGRYLLVVFGITNLILALFNMLPVPPLDGGWIAANIFPAYRRLLSQDFARGITSALFIAVFLGGGAYLAEAAHAGTARYYKAVSGREDFRLGLILRRSPITDPERAKQYDAIEKLLELNPSRIRERLRNAPRDEP